MTITTASYSRLSFGDGLMNPPFSRCYNTLHITVITNFPPEESNTRQLFKMLQDPCYTVAYLSSSKKFLRWHGDFLELFAEYNSMTLASTGGLGMSHDDFSDVIWSLHQQQQQQQQQQQHPILLIHLLAGDIDTKSKQMIERLHSDTNWTVIIVCGSYTCPILDNFPITRIIPLEEFELARSNSLMNALLEPDYDRFKTLKRMKLEGVKGRYQDNIACLANKTVHVVTALSLKLLEEIVLISYNMKPPAKPLHFILYSNYNAKFWDYFIKKHGLLDDTEFGLLHIDIVAEEEIAGKTALSEIQLISMSKDSKEAKYFSNKNRPHDYEFHENFIENLLEKACTQ